MQLFWTANSGTQGEKQYNSGEFGDRVETLTEALEKPN
jgi:hypothetical protein